MAATSSERVAITSWAMAKTCVQVAEASHFELITHLGRTHLVAESFAIATHRKLPEAHPIRHLLGAHLEGTIHINEIATKSLIGQGEAIDQAFAPAISDAAAVAVQAGVDFLGDFANQRFPAKMARSSLPVDMEVPLRDDGMLIWTAVENWVQAYVQQVYSSDIDVAQDVYVKSWASELVSAGRVNKLCYTNSARTIFSNEINTRGCLQQVLSQVIWIATAGHASTNFPQAMFTAYTPLAPVAGYSRGPDYASLDGKTSGQAWLDMLPRAQGAVLQRDFGALLGNVYYNWAGHYLGQYQGKWDGWLDASKMDLAKQIFTSSLAAAGAAIAQSNAACNDAATSTGACKKTRRNSFYAYNVLMPHNIPQSINI